MGTDKALQNHKWHKKNTWHYITEKKMKTQKCTSFGTEIIVCNYNSSTQCKHKDHTYTHF